jgi:hypothetical protein
MPLIEKDVAIVIVITMIAATIITLNVMRSAVFLSIDILQ